MNRIMGDRGQILSWVMGATLALAPVLLGPSAHAQQNQAQPGQQPNWGQAGPPPDAQNGQIPAPPADAQSAQPSDDVAPPPPPPPDQQPGQEPQAGQQGQWGQAGPPPDAQNGQIPGPSQESPSPAYGQQGRAPYQSGPNQQSYRAQPVMPTGPVTIPAGTRLMVRTTEPLDTKKLQPGDYFQATVGQSVYLGNVLAIPRGAQIMGRVVDVKKPGDLKGSAGFTLQVTSLNLGGRAYPLVSDTWSIDGPGKGGYTAGNAVGGAALGAVIGAIAGGGPGAAVGAVAGTGVGLGASAATRGPRSVVPPESMLTFHLTQPATLQPVTYQEAQELQQNSAPPPQQRYPRGYYAQPPAGAGYYYPAPYPYAYAAPYPYPYAYGYPYPYARYPRYRYWR